MNEYDYVVETDQDGEFEKPDELTEKLEFPLTVRQVGQTRVHRKQTMQLYASSNDELEANEDFFEVKIDVWNGETFLIKAVFPDEKSESLQEKIQETKEAEGVIGNE